MAALPSYVIVTRSGAGVQFDPGVLVSEMERGLAKTRVTQNRVVVQVAATFVFRTQKDSLAFEDWYFDVIKRIGFFDWRDEHTGRVLSVRFKGGDIGQLEPLAGRYAVAQRSVTLEYLR